MCCSCRQRLTNSLTCRVLISYCRKFKVFRRAF